MRHTEMRSANGRGRALRYDSLAKMQKEARRCVFVRGATKRRLRGHSCRRSMSLSLALSIRWIPCSLTYSHTLSSPCVSHSLSCLFSSSRAGFTLRDVNGKRRREPLLDAGVAGILFSFLNLFFRKERFHREIQLSERWEPIND